LQAPYVCNGQQVSIDTSHSRNRNHLLRTVNAERADTGGLKMHGIHAGSAA
jgi:hypothetical protein